MDIISSRAGRLFLLLGFGEVLLLAENFERWRRPMRLFVRTRADVHAACRDFWRGDALGKGAVDCTRLVGFPVNPPWS